MNIFFPMPNAQCPMPNAQCPISFSKILSFSFSVTCLGMLN
ncbi:MAG: hypothetical protein V7L04_32140 [Nostoc sp.]